MEPKHILLMLAGVIAASGCMAQGGADPVIVDSSQRQGALDIVQGEATIEAEIRNEGQAGNVTVTAEILGENDNVLTEVSEQFEMEANETRSIEIEMEVPQGAEGYRLQAGSSQ